MVYHRKHYGEREPTIESMAEAWFLEEDFYSRMQNITQNAVAKALGAKG
ncbi:hypothetical protein AAEX28_13270 [Lentisphaerota bacterium WC36G]|nr:hypothetical protein LJT99_00035 [Lentisphaerae bacterium WC36]